MDSFIDIFDKPKKDVKTMSKDELIDELQSYRNLLSWFDDDLRYWFGHIRQVFHVIRRDYKDIFGLLGQPHFKLEGVDMDVVERIYNFSKAIATYETKTVTIPMSQVVDYELSLGKEEVPEQMDGTPIEEAINEANEQAGKELK